MFFDEKKAKKQFFSHVLEHFRGISRPEVRSSYPKTTEGRVSEWAEMAAKTPKSTLERSPDLVKIILDVYIF